MATALEVEAATKAARLTLRPDDVAFTPIGFKVGRYKASTGNYFNNSGSLQYYSLTTAAVADGIHCVFSWLSTAGLAVIKKVNGTMVTGANTGKTAGVCHMKLWRVYGLGPFLTTPAANVAQCSFPPSQGGFLSTAPAGVTGAAGPFGTGTSGLQANQPPSAARLEIFNTGSLFGSTQQGYVDALPIGVLEGGAVATAGVTQFNNEPMFDYHVAEAPLILVPGTGFQVTCTLPGASTSQTIAIGVNIDWDEWTPTGPGTW